MTLQTSIFVYIGTEVAREEKEIFWKCFIPPFHRTVVQNSFKCTFSPKQQFPFLRYLKIQIFWIILWTYFRCATETQRKRRVKWISRIVLACLKIRSARIFLNALSFSIWRFILHTFCGKDSAPCLARTGLTRWKCRAKWSGLQVGFNREFLAYCIPFTDHRHTSDSNDRIPPTSNP